MHSEPAYLRYSATLSQIYSIWNKKCSFKLTALFCAQSSIFLFISSTLLYMFLNCHPICIKQWFGAWSTSNVFTIMKICAIRLEIICTQRNKWTHRQTKVNEHPGRGTDDVTNLSPDILIYWQPFDSSQNEFPSHSFKSFHSSDNSF